MCGWSSLVCWLVAIGKKTKVSHSDAGSSRVSNVDDDFVAPPLVFLARLQQNPVWNALDYDFHCGGGQMGVWPYQR